MLLVLDTNILLVSISPKSSYRWLFDAFLNGEFTICVTTDILLEYEEVFSQHMGEELAVTILQIIENAPNVSLITRYYKWNLITFDADDNKFVDCYIAANADYIVTHDNHFKVLQYIDFPKIEVLNITNLQQKLTTNNNK
ncbi:MAG: putative toxin-antitoxin system toxin component, PIN family [Sphingobacteriales bacterium]|nr:putative toxin-antitoxin system toxin component, PIN family [Sphingobacteriales bacterium]